MTTSNKLDEVTKTWLSLECSRCGKFNPLDVVRCIHCNCIIGRKAALKLMVEIPERC